MDAKPSASSSKKGDDISASDIDDHGRNTSGLSVIEIDDQPGRSAEPLTSATEDSASEQVARYMKRLLRQSTTQRIGSERHHRRMNSLPMTPRASLGGRPQNTSSMQDKELAVAMAAGQTVAVEMKGGDSSSSDDSITGDDSAGRIRVPSPNVMASPRVVRNARTSLQQHPSIVLGSMNSPRQRPLYDHADSSTNMETLLSTPLEYYFGNATPLSPQDRLIPRKKGQMISRVTRAALSNPDRIRKYVIWREWTYQFLEHPRTWRALMYHSLFLACLSVILVLIVLDKDPFVFISVAPLLTLELVLAINIMFEYPLRVWSAGSQEEYRQWWRLRFMAGPLMLVELLGCVNAIFTIIRGISGNADTSMLGFITRVLLLSRVLRLERRKGAVQVLPIVLNEHRHEILFFATVLIISVLLGASVVFMFESVKSDTKFLGLSNALWYSTISSLTVGYGDYVAVTWGGQIATIATVTLAAAFYAISPGIIGTSFALKYQESKKQKRKLKHRRAAAAPFVQTWWRLRALELGYHGTNRKFLNDITTKSTTSLFLNNGGGTVHWSAVQKGREMLAQTEEVSCAQSKLLSVCLYLKMLVKKSQFRVARLSEEINMENLAEMLTFSRMEGQMFRIHMLRELVDTKERIRSLENKLDEILEAIRNREHKSQS